MRFPFALPAAAAMAAVALPVAAQEAPANSGPYYVMGERDSEASLAAGGTRVRQGSEASVTVSDVYAADHFRGTAARMDMAYRFDCDRQTARIMGAATYDVSGRAVQVFGPSGGWLAVTPGSRLDNMMNFACDGTVPDGVTAINSDINSLAARFREIRAGA